MSAKEKELLALFLQSEESMSQISAAIREGPICQAKDAEIARLRARLAEAAEVLRWVEWEASPRSATRNRCPMCRGKCPEEVKHSHQGVWKGHTTGCRLARVLKGEP